MQRVTDRARAAATFVARSKVTILVFAVIWAIGLGALAIVASTQAKVETQLNAQLASQAMQRQLGDLTLIAFAPAFAATIGLDWADKKHDLWIQAADGGKPCSDLEALFRCRSGAVLFQRSGGLPH